MNWHETIAYIRTKNEYADLIDWAYFSEDLEMNIKRFAGSDEFAETLVLISTYMPAAKTILDIGSGNGISAVNFALKGYNVTVAEPDPSDTVGANAIRQLQKLYKLRNLEVYENFAEEIEFEDDSFDIVYCRQAMHHAYELDKFIAECARVVKPGGILMTIRDHVVFDENDKKNFLETHPLQKFYGGENAFTPDEYKQAMTKAGLRVIKELKFFDSVINYFPLPKEIAENYDEHYTKILKSNLENKLGTLAKFPGVLSLYKLKNKELFVKDERKFPGRMYSYVARK